MASNLEAWQEWVSSGDGSLLFGAVELAAETTSRVRCDASRRNYFPGKYQSTPGVTASNLRDG